MKLRLPLKSYINPFTWIQGLSLIITFLVMAILYIPMTILGFLFLELIAYSLNYDGQQYLLRKKKKMITLKDEEIVDIQLGQRFPIIVIDIFTDTGAKYRCACSPGDIRDSALLKTIEKCSNS